MRASIDITTENYQLDSTLTLCDRSSSPLTLHTVNLSLLSFDAQIIECRLTFQVSPELYHRIDSEALFNLRKEVRQPRSIKEFLSEPNIEIQTLLNPDQLPQLLKNATNAQDIGTYLLKLSQEQPSDPLLATENWLGLCVKQTQESATIGYQTFWAYISPSNLTQNTSYPEEISDLIANFVQSWKKINWSEVTDNNNNSELFEEIMQVFNELIEELPNMIAQTVKDAVESPLTSREIFAEMVNFFTKENWSFIKINEQPFLQMSFQGKNATWNCYARAREEDKQFIFYSVCPIKASENKRLAVADFIARANFGMMIGNFELDFTDGEIRYKTSIDVTGDHLNSSLIKNLVYANVTIMDKYLPGLLSVIYSDVLPETAIINIERTR